MTRSQCNQRGKRNRFRQHQVRRGRPLVFERLEDRRLLAGVPELIKDINLQLNGAGSEPYSFVEVDGTLFFAASTATAGYELWKSDGTEAGTVLVKDINSGTGSSYPGYLTNVGGTLFFNANDGTSGYELWKSDGTEAGTVRVKDIKSGTSSSGPQNLTNVGGTLFFKANDGTSGWELWKSDGTEAGTVRVKDIRSGTVSSDPGYLTNVGGMLFFNANDGNSGSELWKSDGTEAGTVRVKDIRSGTGGSDPRKLTNVSGTLFFRAWNGTSGVELWKSDGTEAGTVLVKDIWNGTGSSYPWLLTNVGGTLFFNANDGTSGWELWKSNGTEAGTVRVEDINSGTIGSNPRSLTNVGGTLFFSANDGTSGEELWRSDGTEAGTVRVKDIVSGTGDSGPGNLTNVSGMLFFSANDGTSGWELWKSDGTEAGTVRVKDIRSGTGSSHPLNLTNVGGTLFFSANDGTRGQELWKSNGSESDTALVKDIRSKTDDAFPTDLTNVAGTLFFCANDGTSGYELWKSDGTEAGTALVKDIRSGTSSSDTQNLTSVGGTLFFRANDGTSGRELWKSDGTEAGTVRVKDIRSGTVGSDAQNLTNVGGTLFFSANDGASGDELWKSDGTEAGTVRVKDIHSGTGSSNPGYLTNVGGFLFFSAYDETGGKELWKSDGTEAGTVRVKDISSGTGSSDPRYLTNVGGTLFFNANDGTSGWELWKSDGTEAGTVRVKDINSGTGGSYSWNLTNVGGMLFFSAHDGTGGEELWKSDGTEAGTVRVKDIRSGTGSSNPTYLTNAGGTLFFNANDGTSGWELWKSDGTEAGTVQVKDILSGTGGSDPENLTDVGGTLFFRANDGVHGDELWMSNGSEAGTRMVADIAIPDDAIPSYLTNVDGTLFFAATTETEGTELWGLLSQAGLDIRGSAWHDLNADGVQDTEEPGVAGAVVELFGSTNAIIGDADDVSLQVVITDEEGMYRFVGARGFSNYYLVVRPPVGFAFTTQGAGGDPTVDSDVDAAGFSDLFDLSASDVTLDTGLVGTAAGFGFALAAGSTGDDFGQAIATDADGNVYVTGSFEDTVDFDPGPGVVNLTSSGGSDVFVAKYTGAGTLVWVRAVGGPSDDYGGGIAVDGAGNVYTTGYFRGTVDFDPGTGTFNVTSSGGRDIFVSKLDDAGNFVWTRVMGGTLDDNGMSIAVDGPGNVYTTGTFQDMADFDPGPAIYDLVSSIGGFDIFVSKLDSAGNFLWAKAMGGTDWDYGSGIAVDGAGNVYTTGFFADTVDFDPGAGTFHLTGSGSADIFVSKLDSAGDFVWAKAMGSTSYDVGYGIAVDVAGNVYTTGSFADTVDFDPGPGTFHLTSSGSDNIFVSKLDIAGNFVWARAMGGSGDDDGAGIAVDEAGNVYTTGSFMGTADFDPGANTSNLTSSGSHDIFISKLDSAGNFVWAKAIGGSDVDWGLGIAVDGAGNVYTTGSFQDTADFDPGAGTFPLTSSGSYDIFLSKLVQIPSELLARGVAYMDDWKPGHKVSFDGHDLGYKVDKVFKHDLGFYGLGLSSALHGPALVLRGTDQWRDWASNVHSGGVGAPQFDATWEMVYSEWLEEQTDAVDMIGHSLGGALAQWFAAAFTSVGGQIDQLVTFNSPGIPASEAEKFVPSDTTSVTHYIVNGDVVSIVGEAFIEGTVQMGSFSDLDLRNKHLLPLLEPRIWNPGSGQYRERPDDLTWETISTEVLNRPWFSFTDPDYQRWLLGVQVVLLKLRQHALATAVSDLYQRGTADLVRGRIGRALDVAEGIYTWASDVPGRFVLETRDLVHALYNQFRITVSSEFDLSVENDALRFEGGLSVALGDSIHVRLPWFLGGGEITAEHLVSLVDLDHHGKIDAEGLEVHGQLALLGSLVQMQGSAILDWRKTELNLAGSIDILDGFINANSAAKIGANGHLVLGGAAQIQVPASWPWIGGTTMVGGQFLLNHANRPDPFYDFVAGWGTLAGLPLGIRLRFNGEYDLLGGREIEEMVPAEGSGSSSPLQPQSDGLEIPADRDWALFFLEWEEPSPDVAFQLQTPSGQVLGEVEIEAEPSMNLVAELCSLRRKVIRVEQPDAGAWELRVEDPTGLGEINTTAMVSETPPAVEVLAVSSGLLRVPIELEAAVSGAESQIRVALFYDTDAEGLDGVMIVDGLVPDNEGRVRYTWDTAGVAAGEYYVYARAMDEVNVPVAAYADAPVEISDPLPEVTSLAADLGPVIHSAALTLTAEVAFEPIDDILQIEFYRGDDLLGADAYGSDGWTWTADTTDWPLGEQPVTARAQTVGGLWSDWDSLTVTLIENPAQIHMTIAAERSATGDDGQVASLPASVDWVHEWQTFWVEIWVGAPDMPTLAAAGATVDLRYNTDYLTALEIEHGPAFPLERTGTLEDGSGLAREIGGSAGVSAASTDGYLLLARVRFASTGDDQLPVDKVGRSIGPYDMQIELTEAQTKWVDAGTVVPQLGDTPGTELWAVMYDIEENNRIDFGDLSYFAAAFGLDVGPPESQPPHVWLADFDRSGRVDFGDLAFFAPNFNKNRAAVQSGNQTLIFPPNFPDAWRAGAGGGIGDAGEGEWQELGGAALLDGTVGVGEEAGIEPGQAGDRFAAELAGMGPEAFARPARLPVADRMFAATDGAFAQIGAEGTERWTSVKTKSAGRQWDDIQRHQRPLRLGRRWEPLEDTLSLLAERKPSDTRDDICEPLDALFTKIAW